MRGLADLKSIMFLQHKLPLNARVQYSLLITFKRPILEQTAFTLAAIQKPDHQLHKILAPFPQSIMKSPDFWVEMHMTAPSGNRIANLVMPAGMGEAGAAKANGRDFTSLILGQSLTSLYQTSLDALGDPEMRCAVPLAEVRVRDIVQYRNVKLALKDGLEDIAVRGDSVQPPDRHEYIHEPILAFCGICFKLSTKHKRCGGCKVSQRKYLKKDPPPV